MHVLVSGASGFVGRALTRDLLAAGHRVAALIRPGGDPGVAEPLIHDLGCGTPPVLPAGTEAVVHLAQARTSKQFPDNAGEMFRVNVGGAREMLEAAAYSGVRTFCLVSTGTVYEPFTAPLAESVALAPRSCLGATKLAAEVLAHPFGSLFALSVLRLFAPYGPNQINRLVPDLIRRVRDGVPVTLPEQGNGMRFAPAYVDDVNAVIVRAVIEEWRGVLNVTAPGSITIAEAAETIGAAMGRRPLFERRAMDAPAVVPELTRLAEKYDLARFRDFAGGIRTMLAAGAT